MFFFDFFPSVIFDLFTFFLCVKYYIEYFRRNERQTRKFHRYKLL